MRGFLVRRFGLAAGVLALHGILFMALLTLRPSPREDAIEAALVAVRVPFEAPALAPLPHLDGSYWAPPLAQPSVVLPDISTLPAFNGDTAITGGIGTLGDYLGCGLQSDDAMTADQRAKCDELRKPLYSGTGEIRPPSAEELALQKHFDREKAREDAPILLPCGGFTDVFCIVATALNGFDFKMGSYADAPRPENRLAEPVFPYRPK